VLSYYVSLRSEFRVVMSVFTSSCLSYLCYLCLFAHSGVQHILCCVFVLVFFVLCLVYLMLPFSLDCPFLIGSSVFSNVYLWKKHILC
jgi:hypothetical protein